MEAVGHGAFQVRRRPAGERWELGLASLGVGGGTGQGPRVGACQRQWGKPSEKEKARELGGGESGLGTVGKQNFFLIAAKAQSESWI